MAKKTKKEIYKKDVKLLIKDIKENKVKVLAGQKVDAAIEKKIEDQYVKKAQQVKNLYSKDGWSNLYTGLGTTQDKSFHTTFSGITILSFRMLSEIWIGDGFGKRIVEVKANDMTREWVTIQNDEENIISNKLEMLKSESNCNFALKWKRLFGGGLIAMGINDGRELHEPVNINAVKSVDWLRTFDRTDIQLTDFHFTEDPNDPNYGEVEFFTITPRYGSVFNIHRDRCLIFKGIPVPARVEVGNFWYWGMGELQAIWTEIKDFGAGRNHVTKLLYEFIIGKYKLKDLAELLADGNEDKLRARMNAIDLGKSMIHAILMDTEEDYTRDSANVSGLADLLDRFMIFIAGVSGYPVTRLFGRSPAGENATGKGDEGVYYDEIRAKQKNELKDQIQKLVNYINVSKEIGNKKVDEPIVEFNSLFQQTEEEKMNVKEKQSKVDEVYIGTGVLTSEEVRESRFGEGYSLETTLQEEPLEEEEKEEIMKPESEEKEKE